jgi:hypothetical protein
MDTKLGTLIGEMQLMRDGTNTRLDRVEQGKVEKSDFVDYKTLVDKSAVELRVDLMGCVSALEKKVDSNQQSIGVLNKNMYILIGMGVLLEIVVPIIIKFIFK